MKPILFLIAFLFSCLLSAQKIDNMVAYRDMGSDSYFRFNYDNDYFASTDREYTQGYNFELMSPVFKNNPVNVLFFKPKAVVTKYGLSIEHIGYTPNNIKSPEIQYNERPFSAAIMLKSFSIATDTLRRSRFVSSLNLGLIGPGAFGKEMQVAIHEATGNTIPQGWQNQIKNDVVVNYEISYEKQFLHYRNIFSLQGVTTLRIGTLFTNAAVGCSAVIGIINNPFLAQQNKKKWQVYAYAQPIVTTVLYDATLQGGLFNDKSPYTVASTEISRFTAQHHFGIVLQTKTMYFEYNRSGITKEYDSGSAANWGGIKIGFTF